MKTKFFFGLYLLGLIILVIAIIWQWQTIWMYVLFAPLIIFGVIFIEILTCEKK
jgi:hypothetical protein